MSKASLVLLIALFSIPVVGFCQQIDYATWKEEAKSNIRLLPEYGNAEKTKGQKEADEEFIRASLEQDGTREKASEHMVRLGFDYLYRQDLKTAMYRFNQAWMLNPKNENAYWGFGGVYFMFNDFESAKAQYDKGLALNPKSSNLLTDKATIYMTSFLAKGIQTDLDSAINIFKRSYEIDVKNQNTLFKISACYFMNNDCEKALRYFRECKALGGKPITKEYSAAISKKCGS